MKLSIFQMSYGDDLDLGVLLRHMSTVDIKLLHYSRYHLGAPFTKSHFDYSSTELCLLSLVGEIFDVVIPGLRVSVK